MKFLNSIDGASKVVEDTSHRFVSDSEKTVWNAASPDTIINTNSASTTPSVTLVNNNEYRYTNAGITTLGITIPVSIASDFISSVVFKNPAISAVLTITNNSGLALKYSGDGVSENVFTPVVNTTYNMIFFFDGININCCIRGV